MARYPVWWERIAFKGFAFLVDHPWLVALAPSVARVAQKLHPLIKGTLLDPARPWTRSRELPKVAKQTFKEFWRSRKR